MAGYDDKYDADSSSDEIKSFHAQRRMFAINEGELAPETDYILQFLLPVPPLALCLTETI